MLFLLKKPFPDVPDRLSLRESQDRTGYFAQSSIKTVLSHLLQHCLTENITDHIVTVLLVIYRNPRVCVFGIIKFPDGHIPLGHLHDYARSHDFMSSDFVKLEKILNHLLLLLLYHILFCSNTHHGRDVLTAYAHLV